MLSQASTPQEFIEQLEDDWRRRTLLDIRKILLDQSPQLDEQMHYKMLGYRLKGDYVFHLNAQKAYVSLYVGDASKTDPEGVLLSGLSVGKGCIRFKKADQVPNTRIDAFIARAVSLWREGKNIEC